jgi:uncharacterized protein (TIGR04255 family)
MKIDFEKPPINEMSIGMHFAPVVALRAESIGLFWSRIRAEFPTAQQSLPIGVPPTLPQEFPMPRFWFVAKDDATLIQLQKNLFLFNWRLRTGDYPRFEKLFEAFRKYRTVFTQFLRTELNTTRIEQVRYQLEYNNLFESAPYWSGPTDTARVVPSFKPLEAGVEGKLTGFNYTTTFQLAHDLSLNHSVRNGINNQTGKPVLVLRLEATGSYQQFEANAADGWYERAHTAISESFIASTSPQIQAEYWKPK